MAQNAARLGWKAEKVDARLHHHIIKLISTMPVLSMVVKVSKPTTCRCVGANIAGFVKVADAMLAQGVICCNA